MCWGGKKESDSLVILQTFLLLYTVVHDVNIEFSKKLVRPIQTIIKNLLALVTGAPELLRCS